MPPPITIPDPQSITEENTTAKLQQLTRAVQELHSQTQVKISQGIDRDQRLEKEIKALRSDVNRGFANVREEMGDLRGEMNGLRGEMSDLRGEMNGLRNDVNDKLDQQTELLKMLVENTRR